MAEASPHKVAKRYRSFLENGNTYEALEQLREVAKQLAEEMAAYPGKAAPLMPSKAYKTMRALLQDSATLDMFFTRVLAVPRAGSERDRVFLVHNLMSLRVAVSYREFSELLLGHGFYQKVTPLVLHMADWLETDHLLEGRRKAERTAIALLFENLLKVADVDMEKAAEFVTECGLLAKVRAHLPWKAHPSLDQKTAGELSDILRTASGLMTLSVFVAGLERAQVNAIFASDDVMGWFQRALLWAGVAAEKSAHARAPLDKFVSDTFTTLAEALQKFSLDAPRFSFVLGKLVPAAALADRLKGNASISAPGVSGAGEFFESWLHMHAKLGLVPTGASEHLRELTLGVRFVDTRNPRDLIGVNGDIMGLREGDEELSGQVDWGHVVSAFEAGEEETILGLLPSLPGFCIASCEGAANSQRVARPPKAFAESMVALLESGRCAELWKKAGVLGSFFLVLHLAMFRQESFTPEPLSKQEEDWFAGLGCRLLGWLYARADRLCLQALQTGCKLMTTVLNLTWATRLVAVREAHYLEFGYAIFELLDQFATASPALDANSTLWQAGTEYMAALNKLPITQRTILNPTPDIVHKMNSLTDTCLQRGILEWALRRCKNFRHNPNHKMLLSQILTMASQDESGQERYGRFRNALEIVVAEAEYARERAFIAHSLIGPHPQNAEPRGETAVIIAELVSCLLRLSWLLMTCSSLVLETVSALSCARWQEFCGAAAGLPLLQKVLAAKRKLEELGREHLNSGQYNQLEKAFGCAEKLWGKAASEAGLKKCSNPECTSVEAVKGEFKRCGRCRGESYCGQTCQAAHWRLGHKRACRQVNSA